jgi:hypothetical protein
MATTARRSDELLQREDRALADVIKIRFYPFSAASASGMRMLDADGCSSGRWRTWRRAASTTRSWRRTPAGRSDAYAGSERPRGVAAQA